MSIAPTSATASLYPATSGPRAGRSSRFVVPQGAGQAAETEPAGLISAHSLLSLQEVEPDSDRNRRARRHGLDMMDDLRRLQQGLLANCADPELLLRLDHLASTVPPAADPALRAILDELAVRTRVELARMETVNLRP